MGKRSEFTRRKNDAYQTIDPAAVRALRPYLNGVKTFAEPCVGEGYLAADLQRAGLKCMYSSDVNHGGVDALTLTAFDLNHCDVIISNPPWTRSLLHPLILHFQKLKPTWLLFDADWAFNKQAADYLDQCTDIVAVGRLRWIPGTTNTGKDNAAWYRFWHRHSGGAKFHGRK